MLGWIFLSIVIALALALAVAVVRFNVKRVHIARCAQRASGEQLERIYGALEAIGTEHANGYILARTNLLSDRQECLIPIPQTLVDFPWTGKMVQVELKETPEFHFVSNAATAPMALSRILRPVRVPRVALSKSGKQRNLFAPARLLKGNGPLHVALTKVCPRYPGELLAYLLCVGRDTFEFDEISQARIGTSAAWVQQPQHPLCESCRKRMTLILQLP